MIDQTTTEIWRQIVRKSEYERAIVRGISDLHLAADLIALENPAVKQAIELCEKAILRLKSINQ